MYIYNRSSFRSTACSFFLFATTRLRAWRGYLLVWLYPGWKCIDADTGVCPSPHITNPAGLWPVFFSWFFPNKPLNVMVVRVYCFSLSYSICRITYCTQSIFFFISVRRRHNNTREKESKAYIWRIKGYKSGNELMLLVNMHHAHVQLRYKWAVFAGSTKIFFHIVVYL